MLKFCLMVLSLLFLTEVPYYANNLQFEEDASKAYEVYAEYTEFPNANDSFYLKIIRGKVNGKWCYGVCFTNSFAKTYSIEIIDEKNNAYSLPQDKRGDINAVAIEVNQIYTINVYKDNEKISLYKKAELVPFTEEEFSLTDNNKLVFGEGKGIAFAKLQTTKKTNNEMIYIICGLGVITLGCVIIIASFAKTKKGMFNKEKRSEGVFDFKKFISEDFNEEPKSEFDIIDITPEKDEEEDEDPLEREIYQHTFRYDDDAKSGFPLKEYLADKGYLTDYKLASEEEKQKIMLELMKLKNDKKITEDEYLEEAYKLWKE